MRKVRWYIMAVVFVFFIVSFSSIVWSGPQKIQKKTDFIPKVVVMCPNGWHKISVPGELITCVPDKPEPIKCPEGTIYYEAECAVGCKTEIK